MRILYAAMKYDYGRPEQGFGFEHYNFYDSLTHMGHDVVYFDYMTVLQKQGRDSMNRRLLDMVRSERPDLMMTVLFKEEFDPAVLREAGKHTATFNWFCDDHWRFDTFSRHWAPHFTWIVTTAAGAVPKYAALGMHHVIKSQWGCNHFLYRRSDLPLKYDVTFVGQPHGNRPRIIEALRKAGINVQVWGNGWESGRVDQEIMINIFNQSRINLNLANASVSGDGTTVSAPALPKASFRHQVSRALDALPFGRSVKSLTKPWRNDVRIAATARAHAEIQSSATETYSEQIKGRNFEVPGCGGFLLTGKADNLDQYYVDGKEIVTFLHIDDLIAKVKYFLKHEEERSAIAHAGYLRTLRDHTYANRFSDIFRQMGMPNHLCSAGRLESGSGSTQEVA
ncbi:hypothetical protein W02_16100 [Nitrospira sp. KM1]|uniref:CgeB family protein n=1 Tax=Nitrospira sp. KM1 TaxID=1936990 RepID=UPI0013A76004|nr:glycosyltransferase [Nitrospira sp. KM1]BCA54470.1 hypothetical protein W02_16100 [Nitrospira sp. KM1]